MTFISYAQNFEDVMLWRALKHIEDGFYIDVGARSPDLDSVTRAFYEHGWRGINVEPNPRFHAQLEERRVRDINLRVAICDKSGTQMMDSLSNPGLSTLHGTIAQEHAPAGLAIDKQEAEVTTLADLWVQHVPEGHDVHFLRVDVEGFREAALRGNDWSKYRPWIIIVEATRPISQQDSHEEWESILLTADYHFTYADGFNRYYVANEHAELLSAFRYPPNVFDDFKSNLQNQAETRANEAEARAYALNRELKTTYASYCWRITLPLRAAFVAFLWLKAMLSDIAQTVKRCIGVLLSPVFDLMIRVIRGNPKLKAWTLALVHRYPPLENGMYRFLMAGGIIPGGKQTQISSEAPYMPSTELSKITPRGRRIYTDLKDAIEQHNTRGQ